MPRPREFDRDTVLDRAIEVFWSQGYARTSVQDLVESMGIQRGSLYATFGDKHQLFLEALERYEEHFYRQVQRLLENKPAREGIRAVFEQVLADCACESPSKGCFITNTAVALAEGDDDIRARVRRNLARIEDAFARALESALANGELPPTRRASPRALARFLTNGFQGLRVLSKCDMGIEVLRDAMDLTLSVLDETAPLREPSIS